MGTTRSFQAMLNDYLANSLLKSEFEKRDYLFSNVGKDNGWKGGDLPVPFKGAIASSVAFGGLTAQNDVAEDVYVRGNVSGYKEAWATLLFNHRDILEHDGKVNEDSFLKLLPGSIEDIMSYFKMVVSINMLSGPHFDAASANGTVGGDITVKRPDRFSINQKVIIDDNDSAPVTGYVKSINVNTRVVNFVTTRGGATPVDLSGYTTAQAAKFYQDGADAAGTNTFTSLRSSLLSLANGGSAALYGVTKLDYPHLQAINYSGASITSSNILDELFNALTAVRQYGQGNASEIWMSYTNFGAVLKKLESTKGAFHIVQDSMKVNAYGWTEVVIMGPKGQMKIIALHEMDDDIMPIMDMKALKFFSNGSIRKRKGPDGLEYFTVRNTTGYAYLVDICLFGELVLLKPANCGIIHSIPAL